jgi:carbon monoxide dehydrogenase subunit G
VAAIEESIEISRSPQDVFRYVTDFSHFQEWQGGVVSVLLEDDESAALGSKAIVTRRVGPRTVSGTEEITELTHPRTWTVRGVAGPLVAVAKGVLEPLDEGTRSRLTIALDFEGRGVGKLLVPLVIRRQAKKQLPRNQQTLKKVLEMGGLEPVSTRSRNH